MRARSRAQAVQQVAAAVLSTDVSRVLAPPALGQPGTSVPRSAGEGRLKRLPAGQPEPGHVALQAFWSKSDLIVVVPDAQAPNGVRFRRQKAEHSCFIREADLQDPLGFHRMLNSHASVRRAVWEGDWLRVCWSDRDALRHYCKGLHERGIQTYEGMVSPVLRHMVDLGVQPAPPRQIWVDIETDSRVNFKRAIEGEARVLCWALINAQAETVATGMLDDDTDQDEARILAELWEVLEHYDQVIAWSGDRFDFPVIKARSTRYEMLQPTVREWRRWLWLDHLELFKKFNMNVSESGDEKQSFKLNVIAQSVLGRGKEDFDASKTWEAWAAGGAERARLLEYNITDARLMPEIEQVTGYIALLQTVADTCGTFPDSRGVQPGVQVEGFLARLAHERGHKFPTVLKVRDGVEEEQFLGAYVLHPEKNQGIVRGVHVADFAALYPSIIRTWNMSPETLLGTEVPEGVPAAYSPLTGFYFRTDIPGVLPEAVKQLMDLRAVWNKKKAALPPGTDEWKEADRRAGAYKIATNSFYGVVGSPMSRFYDRRVAESVTQCGKWLIVETIKAAELRGMKVIYGDTDSLFVVGATRGEFEAFVAWCNSDLYPRILAEVGCIDNVVKLAYEKQFDRLVITTAKKYVGNFVHYKGALATADSTPEIKGLEFKRGDSLRMARQMQEEVVHLLLGFKRPFSDEPTDYEEVLQRWADHVLGVRLLLDDVLVSKRLNKELDKYKTPNTPMVRIGVLLGQRGHDVGEGAKVDYVVTDAGRSPQVVIPAEDYDPDTVTIDREAMWDKLIWPPTQRLLEAAFPAHDWKRWGRMVRDRKALQKVVARQEREQAKAAAKATSRRKAPRAPDPPPDDPPEQAPPQAPAQIRYRRRRVG